MGCSQTVNEKLDSPRPPTPISVEAAEFATDVAVGAFHSCALLRSGEVACWGDSSLDGGVRASDERWVGFSPVPLTIPDLKEAVQLVSGRSAVCARLTGQRVVCWGDNAHGEAEPTQSPAVKHFPPKLATDLPANACVGTLPERLSSRNVPVLREDLRGVVDISMGWWHGCAITQYGEAHCWGDGSQGQLGPTVPADGFKTSLIVGLPPAVDVESAGTYNCALTTDAAVWCWGGHNERGQLGTATPGPSLRQVPGVNGAVDLLLTPTRACAQLHDGQFTCWGNFGTGCGETFDRARAPAPPEDFEQADALVLAAGSCLACILKESSELTCGLTPALTGEVSLQGVTSVSAGERHVCATQLGGTVACFGANHRGELGRLPITFRYARPFKTFWPPKQRPGPRRH